MSDLINSIELAKYESENAELKEKLRKERKKKKRWKNKYLKLIVDFNLLRDSYAELQSMYSELRTKYEQCGPLNITFTKKDKDNIDE